MACRLPHLNKAPGNKLFQLLLGWAADSFSLERGYFWCFTEKLKHPPRCDRRSWKSKSVPLPDDLKGAWSAVLLRRAVYSEFQWLKPKSLLSDEWWSDFTWMTRGGQWYFEELHSFLRVAHNFLMNRKLYVPWTCHSTLMFFLSCFGALYMDGNGNHMSWIIPFVHIRTKCWFLPLDLENILSWRVSEASFISNFLTAQFV